MRTARRRRTTSRWRRCGGTRVGGGRGLGIRSRRGWGNFGGAEEIRAAGGAAAAGGGALDRCRVGTASIPGAGGVGRAGDLESLHAVEKRGELFGARVGVESGVFEREQDLVDGFERGDAAGLGLLFDEITARRGGRKHQSRETLKRRGEAEHFPGAAPGGIEHENDEAATGEVGGGERAVGEIFRVGARVEQHDVVGRIVDQGLDGGMIIEGSAHLDFAVGEAEVREAAGGGLFLFELLRVHEEDKASAGGDGHDRAAPAEGLRPETAVAHRTGHVTDDGAVGRRRTRGKNSGLTRAGEFGFVDDSS